MPRERSPVALAVVCLGWGTIPLVAAKIALPAPLIVLGRVWLAALGLAVVTLATRRGGARPLSIAPVRTLATGAILAAHWTAMFAAYARADDAVVIFVIFLAPVAIAIIERPGKRLVAALAIAVAGFGLVAGPAIRAEGTSASGLGLAVISGALFVALVLLSKPLATAYGGLRLTLIELVTAGVVLLPAAAVSDWSGIGTTWPWLLLLGLVHTGVGTAVYFRTLAAVPATEVGILGYLEPVGVVLFAWLVAGDAPALATVAGGLLVIAGGAVAVTTPSTEVTVRVPG